MIMTKEYKSLLDATHEFEGLLIEALGADKVEGELKEQIAEKAEVLSELLEIVGGRKENKPAEQPEQTVAEEAPVQLEEVPEQTIPVNEDAGAYYVMDDDEEEIASRPRRKPAFKPEGQRKKPVFSLNDRFLFIREIFGGDASKFNIVLDRLADFGEYEAAEEYLLKEYKLDREKENDSRFLEIVRAYYR